MAKNGEAECSIAPPSDKVTWCVENKNGQIKTVKAQTAYYAVVRECKWLFEECKSFYIVEDK